MACFRSWYSVFVIFLVICIGEASRSWFGSLRSRKRGKREDPVILHSEPFLIRQWEGVSSDNPNVDELMSNTVNAAAYLCSLPDFECSTIRAAIVEFQSYYSDCSFCNMAAMASAVHFGEIGVSKMGEERKDFLDLSHRMFSMIRKGEPFSRTLQTVFSKLQPRFEELFGSVKYAYQVFEYLFAVMYMSIPEVGIRQHAAADLIKILYQIAAVLDDSSYEGGGFAKVEMLIRFREESLAPIVNQLTQILMGKNETD